MPDSGIPVVNYQSLLLKSGLQNQFLHPYQQLFKSITYKEENDNDDKETYFNSCQV